MNEPQRSLQKAALRYLAFGWSVIPLAPHNDTPVHKAKRGKQPLPKGWPKYSYQNSTEAQIKSWWDRTPEANVGLVCGPASGVLILDVDKGGEDNRAGREVPHTPTVRTGTGGRHLYFRHPEGVVLKNGVKILPGLDTRNIGGQGVLPPSVHSNCYRYRWAIAPAGLYLPSDGAPPAVELADAPAWLLKLAQKGEGPPTDPVPMGKADTTRLSRATKDFLDLGAGLGERNQRLYNATCDMCGCSFSEAEATPLLLEGARRRSPDPRRARRTRVALPEAGVAI